MEDRFCKHCGEKIIAITAHKYYCDENCRSAYFRKTHEGYRQNPKKLVICKGCGKEIETGDTRKQFCSKECRWTYFNSKRPTTKELKRTCPTCGKSFIPMQKRGVGKLYCSKECAYKTQYQNRKHVTVEKGLKYRQKNKMDGNWWPTLQRDKWKCQLCGKYIPFLLWGTKRKLVVHHKDGSGETGKANHSQENLKSLCEQCHRLYHGIHFIEVDGQYFVKGEIFAKLGITEIKVMPL